MAFGIHRSGRRGSNRRAPIAEINVTPLVDVMLVLLVIFMVTAPLLKAGVPIDLPDSRAKALAEAEHPVTIAMTRDGAVYLDDTQVSSGQLEARLATLPKAADGKFKPIILRADKFLDYGRVIAVMGDLNRAGFTSITLVTHAASAEPQLTPALTPRSGTEN
ncbi:MAG: biopolymer transporter ExbD [Novosphingobium sp.]